MNTQNQAQSGQTYQTPTINPYQLQQNAGTTGFLLNSLLPTAGAGLATGQNIFNNAVGGVNQAATSLGNYANQGQNLLGATGAQNIQAGSQGLQSLFSPDYEQQQLNAAMVAPQLQYQQNLAGQTANFGGAGNLGSARQAIAGTALAQQNQMQQQAARAGVANNIAQNRMAAANSLMGGGLNQLQGGLGMGQAGVTAAGAPMNLAQQYGQFLGSFNPYGQANFNNTSGMVTTTGTNTGSNGISILPSLSDVHAKENIVFHGTRDGFRIYDFNYKGKPGRWRGVMAQEVQRSRPEAVSRGADGLLRVDYSQLGFEMQPLGT